MSGYIGSKAVNLSTTGADINGDAIVDGTLTVVGNAGIGTASPTEQLHMAGTFPAIKLDNTDAGGDSWRIGSGSTATGFAGKLQILNEDTATVAMVIDDSGDVGIGTATPEARLHVSNGSAGFEFFPDGIADGTSYMQAFDRVAGTYDSVRWYALEHQFYNAASEGMRLDSSGRLLIATTTAVSGVNLSVQRGATSAIRTVTGTTTAAAHIQFENPNGVVGSITTSGTSTFYNTSSDYRLKENLTSIQGAGDIVKALQPITYNFKEDKADWQDGFLAHELQMLVPHAVTGEKDKMKDEEYEIEPEEEAVLDADGKEIKPAKKAKKGVRSVPDVQMVDYSKLTPILTAALQEALNKIDDLTARIATLEAAP
jgi:hypothetical protein